MTLGPREAEFAAVSAEIPAIARARSLTGDHARVSITANFERFRSSSDARATATRPIGGAHQRWGDVMAEARRMGKSELFTHFAERFEMKRTQAREFFDALTELAEKELKRSGEFVLPGMVKLVVQKRKARMGRNPATGEAIKIPAKTVVKARIAKQLKDTVLPKK
jgi:DNA-binding protein HU-beta